MAKLGFRVSHEPDSRHGKAAFWKILGCVAAAMAGIVLLIPAARFAYHTRTATFELTHFPGNTYAPTRGFPLVDEHGEPRVVLVRKAGEITCYDVFYSRSLKDLLQESSSRSVSVTYRIRFRFGQPFWIETLDVAGLGIAPTTSRYSVRGSARAGNVSPGRCF